MFGITSNYEKSINTKIKLQYSKIKNYNQTYITFYFSNFKTVLITIQQFYFHIFQLMRTQIPILLLLLVGLATCNHHENPHKWGELCQEGLQQSPININKDDVQPCDPNFQFSISLRDREYFHPANTAQNKYVKTPFTGSVISTHHNGKHKVYESYEFHFHHRSEHKINKQHYDLQLHVVHESHDQERAVFGILFKAESGDFPDLFDTWNINPKHGQVQTFPFDGITPPHVYHYQGSLTTHKCTEGVQWFVSGSVIKIKKSSLKRIAQLINDGKPNNRPVQDLNGRQIYESGKVCSYKKHRHSLSGYRKE